MSIADNLNYVNLKISAALEKRRARFLALGRECISGEKVLIVAASKYVGAPAIIEAYDAGIRVFGENKVQDLKAKYEFIASARPEILGDLKFHTIGHLQTNKVRDAAVYSSMIQSVDSVKLARRISEQCEKNSSRMDVLIEIKTSGEETKTGIEIDGARELAAGIASLGGLSLAGVMTMAIFSDDAAAVGECFAKAYDFFEELKKKNGGRCEYLSMGMSGDFELAVEYGANIIRPGRVLFQ